MDQLCLNLGEAPIPHAGRQVRSVPSVVKELFDLDPTVPSGLIWKADCVNKRRKKGEMAGTPIRGGKYYMVSVRGYGAFYAHRIVYYLTYAENPGSMIVRHMSDGYLALGWQNENGQDNKGLKKKVEEGYATAIMYSLNGRLFNLKRLCEHLELPYPSVYQKIKRTKASYRKVFEGYGVHGVERIINTK